MATKERIIKGGVHARTTAWTGQSPTTDKGPTEGIMRTQARRVQIVVADVVRGPSRNGEGVARGSVHLVLVLEAGGREVADGVGPRAGHLRERVDGRGRGRRHDVVWAAGVAAEGPVRVLGLLGAALGAGVGFRLGGLDVAFALELWDELLDDVDLEVVEDVYRQG